MKKETKEEKTSSQFITIPRDLLDKYGSEFNSEQRLFICELLEQSFEKGKEIGGSDAYDEMTK